MTSLADIIAKFENVRVVVIGDIVLDRFVIGETNRIAPDAPVPVLRIEKEVVELGGAGNVARVAAELGGMPELIGVLGEDDFGNQIVSTAAKHPRLKLNVVRTPNHNSIVKTRFIAGTHQLLRVDREQSSPVSNTALHEIVEMVHHALKSANVLILSDYAQGVTSDAVVKEYIEVARNLGIPVLVDTKSQDLDRFVGADVLTPNALEAAQATGIDCGCDAGAAAAAKRIAEIVGCSAVLITRGANGTTALFERKGECVIEHHPSSAHKVTDVTGAGDTLVAAMALALGSGASMETAVEIANVAAGIAVGAPIFGPERATNLQDVLGTARSDSLDLKLVDLRSASEAAMAWRRKGKRVVLTNGCFDLIHPGHVHLLKKAKLEGDCLIVALNGDASIRRLKGADRPIQDTVSRAIMIASMKSVDLITFFEEDTPADLISAIRPDVLVKGADYAVEQVVGAKFVQSYGGQVTLIPLLEGHSTTKSILRARGKQSILSH